MPPSITYWNRLEPRPRAPSISQTLAAQIRDPLWMLTRQWQFGEFHGEDAASIAYVELAAHQAQLLGWRWQEASQGKAEKFSDPAKTPPLEELVESEPFTPDFALRVELGQLFETLLNQAGVSELRVDFRAAYPISLVLDTQIDHLFDLTANLQPELDLGMTLPPELAQEFQAKRMAVSTDTTIWVKQESAEWMVTDNETGQNYAIIKDLKDGIFHIYLLRDHEAIQFLRVCAGRVIDGVALYEAWQLSEREVPSNPVIPDPNKKNKVKEALEELEKWILEVFGAIGQQDPPAWQPERLEYGVEVVSIAEVVGAPGTKMNIVLPAYPGRDGDFDWHAFDLRQEGKPVPDFSPGDIELKEMNVLPMHVRFRGMPNARWWDFEASTTDFGDIRPDKRDLAKLIIMDFMLVAGNDWFVIPFDQRVGTLCWVDSLQVHDVFGETILVKRAEQMDDKRGTPAPGERWTMFSTSRESNTVESNTSNTVESNTAKVADFFFLLPLTAATATQVGPTIEEVRFLRDEMANMVWGVENTIENGVGQPWLGHERDLAAKPATSGPPAAAGSAGGDKPPLRYQIQTIVPTNWIPFRPVLVDTGGATGSSRFALEITAMLDASAKPIPPVGRILQPTNVEDTQLYRVREEEVSREGTRVMRVICRSRWKDGSTHLWIARRKAVGMGEGSSGLRFDLAVPTQ